MAGAKKSFQRAVVAHREALGLLSAVRDRLEAREAGAGDSSAADREQAALADRLARLAAQVAPGWLGADWDELARERYATGRGADPGEVVAVRLGHAEPAAGKGFPVLVPLVGAGHVAFDRDATDPAVLGLLRSLLTRLLAALPPGSLRVLAVDGGALGAPFAPFRQLVDAGVMTEPATDAEGLRALLDRAEEQVRDVQSGLDPEPGVLLLVAAALPPRTGRIELARIAALAHAGPAARVHLVLAGADPQTWPRLERTTTVSADGRGTFRIGDPPGGSFGRNGLNAPVTLDPEPGPALVTELGRAVAAGARVGEALDFDDLIPAQKWTGSSVDGLETVIGRAGREPAVVRLDDATPHWLVGGRTGSGKTVFLLDVLYGLAARYSPDELALFLLDFKEGVSFTEFVPTVRDPTWVPHARTVGVESDREYGLAVLRELAREMGRRATAMKQAGVTGLAQLRAGTDRAHPRIVAVIDEFHVLFQGGDDTADRAAVLLEEIARKGRSYGIHLVLATQSVSGIEALYARSRSVFGQFGLRIALSGGGGVLEVGNTAADGLRVGEVVLNAAAGVRSGNRAARFPDADQHSRALLRHLLWDSRTPGTRSPDAFIGHAEHTLEQDPTYLRLTPAVKRPIALFGRGVDIGLPATGMTLERAPGRHLAIVGTSVVGADMLHASCLSLAQQYGAGQATFLLAGLVAAADDLVEETARGIQEAGQVAEVLDVLGYRETLTALGRDLTPDRSAGPTFVVVFGADAAASTLKQPYPESRRAPIDDLRAILREGPMRGIHVLGWWRGFRRLTDDLGTAGKDDIAGFVALNLRGNEFSTFVGHYGLEWTPQQNRALFIDRHDDGTHLLVPFVRPGRHADLES